MQRLLSKAAGLTSCARYSSSSTGSPPQRTCLYDLHVAHGGKMVDFAGWMMPVQYDGMSIGDSTRHTRQHVSIFDVSHMLQTVVRGKDRLAFMESLTTIDLQSLPANSGSLTVFTNDQGGIRDDLIVTKTNDDYLYVVTNAGCIAGDTALLKEHLHKWTSLKKDVHIEHLHGRGLLAVQGPGARKILHNALTDSINKLYFMQSVRTKVLGIDDCRVTRCGYTGEDGVEISVAAKDAPALTEKLLKATGDNVRMAGLGARDALRLEAGLCLYGHDIDATTTPIEAGLLWLIAKRRREAADFPGAKVIMAQVNDKSLVKRKRVGFLADGRPVRDGAQVVDASGKVIGAVTSGCPSPCLNKNIDKNESGLAFRKPVVVDLRPLNVK